MVGGPGKAVEADEAYHGKRETPAQLSRGRIRKPTKENLEAKGWLQSAAIGQSLVGHARQFLFRDVTRERGIDPGQFYDSWKSQRKISITGGVCFTSSEPACASQSVSGFMS